MSRINTAKLHRLIKSLKKEEKRYFKIFTKRHKQNNKISYLEVFNYLDKMEEVDREKFKKRFQHIKGISGMQSYLYNLILKSLRNQSADNIDTILQDGLIDLDILYKKELQKDAQDKLLSLIKLAKHHDKIFFLPMLYDWWFKLETSRFRYQDVSPEQLAEQINRYQESIENLKQFAIRRTQVGRIFALVEGKNTRQAFDELQAIIQEISPYQKDKSKTRQGITTHIQELQLRRIVAAVLFDAESAFFYTKEMYDAVKSLPKDVFEDCKLYYYSAILGMMMYAPDANQLIKTIKEIEAMLALQLDLPDKSIPMHVALHKLEAYVLSRDFENIEKMLQDGNPEVELILKYPHYHYPTLFRYYIILYSYSINNYDEALRMIDQYLLKKEVGHLLKNPSLFIKMIIYYELEEYDLLDYFLKNIRRSLKSKNLLLGSEKQLVQLMERLIRTPKNEHRDQFIKARASMLKELETLSSHEKEFLIFFNYIGWIDSQIHKTTLAPLFFRHVGMIKFSPLENEKVME